MRIKLPIFLVGLGLSSNIFAGVIQLACEGIVSGTSIKTERKNVDLQVDLDRGIIAATGLATAPG